MASLISIYILALQEHRVEDWMVAREAIYIALLDRETRL